MKMNLSSRCSGAALLLSLVCATSGAFAQDGAPAPAKTAPAPANAAAAALVKQAGALEAGGKVHEAADTYMQAGKALKAAGNNDEATKAFGKAADLYAKEAAALLKELDNPTSAPAPQPAAPAQTATAAAEKIVKLPPMAPKAGTISGRVVNEMGAPVPRFTIKYWGYREGAAINNGVENVVEEVNGSGGAYSIKVPPGVYGAKAWVTYEYHGRTYKFRAEPLNPPAQYDYNSKQISNLNGGLVRDFILKLSARKAGASEESESGYFDAYGGGTIMFDTEHLGAGPQAPPPLYATIGARPYSPDSRLLVTLTPQGPMVDGSTGRVVNINVRLGDNGLWQGSQRGVYPGIYSATATLSTPEGETVPLRLGVRNSRNSPSVSHMEWTPSVTVDFLPYVYGLDGGLQRVILFPAK